MLNISYYQHKNIFCGNHDTLFSVSLDEYNFLSAFPFEIFCNIRNVLSHKKNLKTIDTQTLERYCKVYPDQK